MDEVVLYVCLKFEPGLDLNKINPLSSDAIFCCLEITDAHKSGRIASLLTVESGHSIGTSLAVLRQAAILDSDYSLLNFRY